MTRVPIAVANVDELLGAGFSHIEMWKSEDLGNSYQPLTAALASPPTLLSLEATTAYRLGGKSIVLDFSGTPVTFPFEQTLIWWSPSQVVAKMNQVRSACASVFGMAVSVVGEAAGRGQYIKVLSAPEEVFAAGAERRGVDAFVPLVSGQVLYTYLDLGLVRTLDRYRWRFSAAGLAPYTEMSGYQKPRPGPLDLTKVSVGFARFHSVDGSPARGRLIIVEDNPFPVSGAVVMTEPLIAEADAEGFLQVRLLKGSTIKVAIEGTSIVRSIIVPNVPSFDILTALGAVPDAYTPATTAPLLTRRSI
jgi:hypothetical protein